MKQKHQCYGKPVFGIPLTGYLLTLFPDVKWRTASRSKELSFVGTSNEAFSPLLGWFHIEGSIGWSGEQDTPYDQSYSLQTIGSNNPQDYISWKTYTLDKHMHTGYYR